MIDVEELTIYEVDEDTSVYLEFPSLHAYTSEDDITVNLPVIDLYVLDERMQ